jgi:uncharacterized protein YcgL (UPF0745 family)
MMLAVTNTAPLVGADAGAVLKAIEEQGYYFYGGER